MKELTFKGFTPNTFQFLKDLKENNYKEWFDENKHVYEQEPVSYTHLLWNKSDQLEIYREFSYEDYKTRMS